MSYSLLLIIFTIVGFKQNLVMALREKTPQNILQCRALSKELNYDKETMLRTTWTSVYSWKNDDCVVFSFSIPTEDFVRRVYEEVGHQLKEQPNWADPVLMMTVKFKNKMLTHNALLFKDVGFPGNFRIVPDLAYEPQPADMTYDPQPLHKVSFKLMKVSSSQGCPKTKFMLILLCDTGVIVTAEVQGQCPRAPLVSAVASRLKLYDGRLTCFKEYNITRLI
ncbi:uncharacterized protein LOC105385689 [Plutella xylostella]|uniref:uncharacterized protein LOC105385689 n=1 Tax=Plutella xylostella TaxID=51655 RepID=UPI0020324CC6|nr:uncharacterized protein LOC105385689 [Plutella xylostella]